MSLKIALKPRFQVIGANLAVLTVSAQNTDSQGLFWYNFAHLRHNLCRCAIIYTGSRKVDGFGRKPDWPTPKVRPFFTPSKTQDI